MAISWFLGLKCPEVGVSLFFCVEVGFKHQFRPRRWLMGSCEVSWCNYPQVKDSSSKSYGGNPCVLGR